MTHRIGLWTLAIMFSAALAGCSSDNANVNTATGETESTDVDSGESDTDDSPAQDDADNGVPEGDEDVATSDGGEEDSTCTPDETGADEPTDTTDESDESELECGPPGWLSFLSVADSELNDQVDMVANFYRINQPISLEQITSSVEPVLDMCTVAQIGGAGTSTVARPVDLTGLNIGAVLAGEVISVFSPAGSYAELTVTDGLDPITYENAVGMLSPPAPRSLSYAIPGSEFPASMDNIGIPDIEPLEWIAPARDTPIGPDAVFSWVPDANESSSLFLVLANFQTVVACAVDDDGDFQLPAQTQAELGDSFQSLGNVAIRFVYEIAQRGDTVDVTVRVAD